MQANKHLSTILACGLVIFGLSVSSWIKTPDTYSLTERRVLAKRPKISMETLESGKFMKDFEDYSLDQFPLRNGFRSLKAVSSKYAFSQKDNHGLYSVDGYVSKLEYPLNETLLKRSLDKILEIQNGFLQDTDCQSYMAVIQDKNYYLAPEHGYLTLDYGRLEERVRAKTDFARWIPLEDLLSLEDFYKTDQHWRQENILDVAERIAVSMGCPADGFTPDNWRIQEIDTPFYGAYASQAALSFEPDTIRYLTNDILDNCIVTSYNTGKAKPAQLYNFDKAGGRDPYEMFLSGADPLLMIENPMAETDRELIVFRDSFGSSLVPLLIPSYTKIAVVDLRYIRSNLLPEYIEFKDQDVLFLYSTLILNNAPFVKG